MNYYGFNPCFNGSMYKNVMGSLKMAMKGFVSILVLMDLCIKTLSPYTKSNSISRFNPCFNGSMYKNSTETDFMVGTTNGFNPCFNGSMYKNKEKD